MFGRLQLPLGAGPPHSLIKSSTIFCPALTAPAGRSHRRLLIRFESLHKISYKQKRNYHPYTEGEGFEPSKRFHAYTLSKRAPSATRPPLLSRNIPQGLAQKLQPIGQGGTLCPRRHGGHSRRNIPQGLAQKLQPIGQGGTLCPRRHGGGCSIFWAQIL